PIGANTPTSTTTRTPTASATAVLVGHVTWQSRPAQPNALQQLPITITVKSGATEVNYPLQTTDASGFFTVPVTGLANGSYNWRVKSAQVGATPPDYNPGFLAVSGTLTLTGALITNVEMGLQRSGDVDNNNVVNAPDFAVLKGTFGKSIGQPGYDNRADFTGDTVVNSSDFTALKTNFGLGGAGPIGP
ncbi:MAG: dockerin type I domain-containing protein, partial [Chloroflexia bacterium]